MRTDEEILAYYEGVKDGDFFGTIGGELICRLPFELAKPFLKDEVTSDDYTQIKKDEATIRSEIAEYMEFAWEKALGHRGLSASRSIDHMRGLLFLLGDSELLDFANADDNYPQYGVPILKRICEKMGIAIPDDPAVSRMAEGRPCENGCVEGCGS